MGLCKQKLQSDNYTICEEKVENSMLHSFVHQNTVRNKKYINDIGGGSSKVEKNQRSRAGTEALIRDFSLPQSERSPLTKEWKRRRFEVTALCLSVGRRGGPSVKVKSAFLQRVVNHGSGNNGKLKWE